MEQDHSQHTHDVRIHIDREPHTSPTPTTGAALYDLGNIPKHFELFREVDGNREDTPVPDDDSQVNLQKDEHFYSQKEFNIVVNARPKLVTKKILSFDEVVQLAFDQPPTGQNILFTVTFRKGPRFNPEGTLTDDHTVRIKNGMIFNVTATDKS